MDDFYDQQSARDPNIDQKVGDMEKTLKKVKDATGVSQLSELLQKLRTFQQTNEQLSSLKSQYETKLADLREKRKSLQSYSASEVSLHESSIQEKQRDIAAMRKEMADKKSQLDQVNRLNSSVRLGLQQLFEKLQVVNVSDVVIDEDFRVQNDNVVDAIKICAQKITQLHKNLKAKEDAEVIYD
jgi:coiled-coil domain-containing protein 151